MFYDRPAYGRVATRQRFHRIRSPPVMVLSPRFQLLENTYGRINVNLFELQLRLVAEICELLLLAMGFIKSGGVFDISDLRERCPRRYS